MNEHFEPLPTIAFRNDWMGGKLVVVKDGADNVFNYKETITVRINARKFVARRVEISGVDHDHGHAYHWNASDYHIEVGSELGAITMSIKDLLQEGTTVYLYD